MTSKSTCDCYCKTRLPLASQRSEIRSNRNRIDPRTKCSFEHEVMKSYKDDRKCITKILGSESFNANVSDDESSTTPILSPETSDALENAARIIKDAQLQLKEITMHSNRSHVRRNRAPYINEPPIDDEDERLLYIRERVSQKLHEANGWSGECSQIFSENQERLSGEENARITMKKIVDLSAPKFKTSEKRYEEFVKYGMHRFQKSNDIPEILEDTRVNDITTRMTSNGNDIHKKLTYSIMSETLEKNNVQKTENFCIQVGPSINIERKLVAQNLEDVHISPDPSFVQENLNVGIYEFQHDPYKTNRPALRKEKFVKIPPDNKNTRHNIKAKSVKQVSKNHKIYDDRKNESNSVHSESIKKSTSILKKSLNGAVYATSTSSTNYGESVLSETTEIPKDLTSNNLLVNERNNESETAITKELEKYDSNERKSDYIPEIDDPVKIISETKNNEYDNTNRKESCPNEQIPVDIDQKEKNVRKNSLSVKPETKNQPEDMKTDDHNNIPQAVTQSACFPHTRKGSLSVLENNDKREREKRYEIVEQRFANIFKSSNNHEKINIKCCIKDESLSGSTETSEEIVNFVDIDLYRPSMDELDNVITTYNNMLDKIVEGGKAIDRFLSRPDLAEYYYLDDKTFTENSTLPSSRSEKHGVKSPGATSSHVFFNQTSQSKDREINSNLTSALNTKNYILLRNEESQRKQVSLLGKLPRAKISSYSQCNKNIDKRRKCNALKSEDRFVDHIEARRAERFQILKDSHDESNEETDDSCLNLSNNCKFVTRGRSHKYSSAMEPCSSRAEKKRYSTTKRQNATSPTKLSLSSEESMEQNVNKAVNHNVTSMGTHIISAKARYMTKAKRSPDNNTSNRKLYSKVPPETLKDMLSNVKKSSQARTCHFTSSLLQEEKPDVERKTYKFKETGITPSVVKYFLEHLEDVAFDADAKNKGPPVLQKLMKNVVDKKSVTNVENHVRANDTSLNGSMQNIEDISTSSDFQTDKSHLQRLIQSDDNLNKYETVKCDKKVVEKCSSNEDDGRTISHDKYLAFSENRLSEPDRENKSYVTNQQRITAIEITKIDAVTPEVAVSVKSEENNSYEYDESIVVKHSVSSRETKNNTENVNTAIKSVSSADECVIPCSKEEITETEVSHIMGKVTGNENTCEVIQNTNVPCDTSTHVRNEENKTYEAASFADNAPALQDEPDTADRVIVDEKITFSIPANCVTKEENLLESGVCRAENKTAITVNEMSVVRDSSARILSSGDSLQDCISLSSLPSEAHNSSHINKVHTIDASTPNANKIEHSTERTDTIKDKTDNHGNDKLNESHVQQNVEQDFSKTNEPNDREILTEEIRVESCKNTAQNLLYPIFSLRNSVTTEQKYRSNSVSEAETTKAIRRKFDIETSSDTSHSEGELYMPSSCSYSLGEVRVLKRTDLVTDERVQDEDSVAVLVTKSMLTSWNDSSNSVIESAGEI